MRRPQGQKAAAGRGLRAPPLPAPVRRPPGRLRSRGSSRAPRVHPGRDGCKQRAAPARVGRQWPYRRRRPAPRSPPGPPAPPRRRAAGAPRRCASRFPSPALRRPGTPRPPGRRRRGPAPALHAPPRPARPDRPPARLPRRHPVQPGRRRPSPPWPGAWPRCPPPRPPTPQREPFAACSSPRQGCAGRTERPARDRPAAPRPRRSWR